jgi:uncharacterized membrane-anchored protein
MRCFVVFRNCLGSLQWLALGLAWMTMTSAVAVAADSKDGPDKSKMQKQIALFESIDWQDGPGTGRLGTVAEVKIPAGYRFTGQDGARKWAELNQNIPSNADMGVLIPKGRGQGYVVFEYQDSGHVKDDEKSDLDAAAIFESLREGNDQGNVARRQRGWPALELVGWQVPPSYDDATHHLVWALRVRSEGGENINYNTKFLGRTGVMSAVLVVDPEKFDAALAPTKQLLTGFQFTNGSKYAEWKPGEKLAEYGLTGLITGGLVVAAAKTGLLAKLGVLIAKFAKVIIIGIVALGAGIAKFFRSIFGGGKARS